MSYDLKNMSPEERASLKQQLLAEEEAEKASVKKAREDYRLTVEKTVGETIKDLQVLSGFLSQKKAEIYNSFNSVLKQKKELFGFREGQQSHSFTDKTGNTIEIGYRIIDAWDDTAESGVAKIQNFLKSLAKDDESANLVEMVNRLLKKDAKGNLKANRVLELQAMAEKIKNKDFREGVEIISGAHRPVRTALFIEASTKDKTGKKNIPLSLTTVDFPGGMEILTDEL